jgi:hypothetical protein
VVLLTLYGSSKSADDARDGLEVPNPRYKATNAVSNAPAPGAAAVASLRLGMVPTTVASRAADSAADA